MIKKVITLVILIIVLILAVNFRNSQQAQPVVVEPVRATLSGVHICLPHKNAGEVHTMECAFGLKTDSGETYALNFNLMSQIGPPVQTGMRFTANGVITPLTKDMEKYDAVGLFSVTDGVQIEEVKNIPADITGTWVWKETLKSGGKKTSPKKPGVFSITFVSDGKLTGTTDCNGFFGEFNVKNKELSFGDFGMTKMFCEGSQEMEFMNMVSESDAYLINPNGDLVLHMKGDAGSVVFTKK